MAMMAAQRQGRRQASLPASGCAEVRRRDRERKRADRERLEARRRWRGGALDALAERLDRAARSEEVARAEYVRRALRRSLDASRKLAAAR